MAARPSIPVSPSPNGTKPTRSITGGFRPSRQLDGRLLLGLGMAAVSMVLLALGLHVVLPQSQTLLQATRDLDAGAVVQADDVRAADVRVPDSLAHAAFTGDATDQVVGRRLGTRVAAGQLLAPTQFRVTHTTVAPGRVQVTVPVEPYTASAGQLGPGDTVVVYSTPREAAQAGPQVATVVLGHAVVVEVGRGSQGVSVASGGGAPSPLAGGTQPTWVTLDLDITQGARLTAAARQGSIDVAPLATAP
jgi:Flp pilus assembly protein CpaB